MIIKRKVQKYSVLLQETISLWTYVWWLILIKYGMIIDALTKKSVHKLKHITEKKRRQIPKDGLIIAL
jgi:hypothetical protein